MTFKRLEGLTKAGNTRTLFRATIVSQEQFDLAQSIIAHFEGETKLTRKQCRDAHGVLKGKKAAPYFISKNVACKTKAHGVYDLSKLRVATAKREKTAKRENKRKKLETPDATNAITLAIEATQN
jgi:hypothetical protein